MSYMYKYLVRATMIGSLGASGAVYAVMAFAIKEYPELSVSLLFLPFIPLTGSRGGGVG
jgi:membrane associated rhomboid family serine protease